jgi:haloacetate dehalogenase
VICADPDGWYRTPSPDEMGHGNHEDVWAAFHDPAVVHGMCEDYRAGLGVDREHDEADRAAGRRIGCPTMLLEAAYDDLDIHGDPAAIWAPWLEQPLRHRIVESGHHQAEQAPQQVAAELLDFLA